MRWAWLAVICGCGFAPDATKPPVTDDGGDGDSGSVQDAPSDADKVFMDAPECSTAGFACNGASVHVVNKATCNNGCWVSCTSDLAVLMQTTAEQACKAWGGHLAPLRTFDDQVCVGAVLFPQQASWIGYTQAAGAPSVGAQWSWNGDGVTSAYVHWSPGQPNDADGNESGFEQCAMMTTNGEWQDVMCSGTQLYRYSCRHD